MPRSVRDRADRLTLPVVPDRIDPRDRPYRPPVAAAPPPPHDTHKGTALPVLDQGRSAACTGFALASVVNFLLARAGRRDEGPVSPHMLYSMARRYDGFPGAGDVGSSLRGALKGWYRHGVCAERLWPEAPMPPPSADPAADWWQDAARRPLGAYYRVDVRSLADMHAALDEAGVLYASALCHEGWRAGWELPPAERRRWRIPVRRADPDAGGHAFVIVGYDEHGFLILNSWGRAWGDGGVGRLAYEDWLDHALDCWVAQLGVVTEQHLAVARAVTVRTDEAGRVQLATDRVLRDREVAPFVVDMENNGELSRSGAFRTQEADLEALLTIHLPEARRRWGRRAEPLDLAVYAHGGLTGEDEAAAAAARWLRVLYEAQIFPVFLLWETDLLSTLRNRLADLAAGAPRPTGGLGTGAARLWNRVLETTLAPAGSAIWDEMKQNAAAISANPASGARKLYAIGAAGPDPPLDPARVRLHLVGHSAGAIVLSHAVDALAGAGWRFASVTFLAPAVRVDAFAARVVPHLAAGRVARYAQFHLADDVEQRDPTCRPLLGYGRSLLYLVSEAFEHGVRTPILGLERYFAQFVAGLPPAARARVRGWTAPAEHSRCVTHGGFDDDEATMRAVVRLIKDGAPP